MIVIGLVLWALLIIVMMELTSPGFILLTLALTAVAAGVYFGAMYLSDRKEGRKK